ncbi:MAG: WXG100 family type VII secretion target [Armatimonadota bacterium]
MSDGAVRTDAEVIRAFAGELAYFLDVVDAEMDSMRGRLQTERGRWNDDIAEEWSQQDARLGRNIDNLISDLEERVPTLRKQAERIDEYRQAGRWPYP